MDSHKGDFSSTELYRETFKTNSIEHIECRGFLCHELTHLFGGMIEYRPTPWGQFHLKILERVSHFFRLSGGIHHTSPNYSRHGGEGRIIYRLIPKEGERVIFNTRDLTTMDIHPPILGFQLQTPQLDWDLILKPPFTDRDLKLHKQKLWEELSRD